MKSLKSLLSLTALALAVSGSALASENALSSLKNEATNNINSMVQSQKQSAVTNKNNAMENVVNAKEKATESAKSLKDSAKASTKNTAKAAQEKVKSVSSSDNSSMKEKATEKFNVAKDKVKAEQDKIASSAKVNINKADAATLQKLSGIGEKKAQAIVDYRNKVGKIKNVAELSNIEGLGSTTIEKIAPYLTF
ncbi:ComEA family DNA-binding protein [Rodentibacter trehalosifermentans]|uniref:Competence protein ComEA n=1 Tax=Rodentibacter trehalosifermentans TaxID=1908263 RepID=A0A1V3INB5_9PAST|nr:helix-hairpin-helix domain-containing protein [Rodentibacter trehalosifermentans]OOF43268.1 competence protein ComEA [Rodentibacter trehalosifermentans]OOF46670.1 competence protein ComEA [Rodentibacter trehalosifermentans]OOF52375.1 competence protein ComEA [Rodentibacter trehalosifermentans]